MIRFTFPFAVTGGQPYDPDGFSGVEELVERLREKYENDDFSTEETTVTVNDIEYSVQIQRKETPRVSQIIEWVLFLGSTTEAQLQLVVSYDGETLLEFVPTVLDIPDHDAINGLYRALYEMHEDYW